jgi:hypothetical protein
MGLVMSQDEAKAFNPSECQDIKNKKAANVRCILFYQ